MWGALTETLLAQLSIILEAFTSQAFPKLVFLISEECGRFFVVCVGLSVGNDTNQTQKNFPESPWLPIQVEVSFSGAPPSCSLSLTWSRSSFSHSFDSRPGLLPPCLASLALEEN